MKFEASYSSSINHGSLYIHLEISKIVPSAAADGGIHGAAEIRRSVWIEQPAPFLLIGNKEHDWSLQGKERSLRARYSITTRISSFILVGDLLAPLDVK